MTRPTTSSTQPEQPSDSKRNRTSGDSSEVQSNETTAPASNRDSLGEISHSNPLTGETAGQLFNRGPIVAADGGVDPTANGSSNNASSEPTPMKDVSHTPPHDAEDANAVFERGEEHEGDV